MASYSVLIPVYNEEEILEEKIGELGRYLEGFDPDYSIIVCSNGSTDKTDEIGSRISHPKFRFISLPDRGVGKAFKHMVKTADTQKLVSIDVDLTSDLKFIEESVGLLDEYNIVVGSKKKGKQERRWYRTFISDVFIKLVRLLVGLEFSDYSIGTKAWRRSDILGYVDGIDHGSSYVIELIYYVKRDGGRIKEIPVYCFDTRGSKFNIVNEVFYRLKNLLSLWSRIRKA